MIKPELQKEIIEYGSNLHVSQRGLFIKASSYPRWKKIWLQWLIFEGQDISDLSTVEELLNLTSVREDSKKVLQDEDAFKDWENKNIVLAFLLFLKTLILAPFVSLAYSPYSVDIIKQKLTWGSTPLSLLIEAQLLGVLIDQKGVSQDAKPN